MIVCLHNSLNQLPDIEVVQVFLRLLELLAKILHEPTEVFFFGRVTESENGFCSCMVHGPSFLQAVGVNSNGA